VAPAKRVGPGPQEGVPSGTVSADHLVSIPFLAAAQTPNWQMTQLAGLVKACVAFPQLKGSADLLQFALEGPGGLAELAGRAGRLYLLMGPRLPSRAVPGRCTRMGLRPRSVQQMGSELPARRVRVRAYCTQKCGCRKPLG
jgi:hypothetical protein